MITYQRWPFIKIAEVYFDEELPAAGADIVRSLWRPTAAEGISCEESRTLVLNLTNSPQTLLTNTHGGTRWSIRRAERDHFHYEFWGAGDLEALSQFCRFYDGFAATSHLVPANRKRLHALMQLSVLDLSRVSDSSGRALVWHAHYRTTNRARLLHSASLLGMAMDSSMRGLIGRANCHHTWCDILRFQESGLATYDLGGWYSGTTDKKKLGINRFKESFGGTLIQEFNAETGGTVRGRLALDGKAWLLGCVGWYRNWRTAGGAKLGIAASSMTNPLADSKPQSSPALGRNRL